MRKRNTKEFFNSWLYILIALGVFAILALYLGDVVSLGRRLFAILGPVIFGGLLAFALNLLLVRIERLYFPNSDHPLIKRSRRSVSLFLSILIVLGVIAIILGLVIPQMVKAIGIVSEGLPKVYVRFINWVRESDFLPDTLREKILFSDFDFNSMISKGMTLIQNWVGNLIGIAGRVVSHFMDLVLSIMFAIYLLANKERLVRQFKKLGYAYLPDRINISISHILIVANETFASYFGGQFLSAFILGILTAIGMLILGLPFVPIVASVVGITALIPILGAYIGNIVGVILIITVSPLKALIFSIFLIILQQIEGNLIYPKIVGTRVGLAAHWILLAIVVGGGIGGVLGVLIAVPILATIYHLVKEDVEFKTGKRPADGIERIMTEAKKPRQKRTFEEIEPVSEVTGSEADSCDHTGTS
ncbi:MAG: AI-2E family transporter [Saccharofermentanales bacterium]|jgi:predicted PurR-regulated permease PerM|nr:AI-2E family transporter [Bacillota bacterium]